MELITGKNDFTTSVEKSLTEIDPRWKNFKGLLIVGSHSQDDIEEKLRAIKEAREKNIPTLGICLGMQLMAIEYAQNVLGILDATSEEFGMGTPIIKKLTELRVGIRPVTWKGKQSMESHWHNYHFNHSFLNQFQDQQWNLSINDGIVEVMEYKPNRFFIGVQFHPEYGSSKGKPHPLLVEFLKAARITA